MDLSFACALSLSLSALSYLTWHLHTPSLAHTFYAHLCPARTTHTQHTHPPPSGLMMILICNVCNHNKNIYVFFWLDFFALFAFCTFCMHLLLSDNFLTFSATWHGMAWLAVTCLFCCLCTHFALHALHAFLLSFLTHHPTLLPHLCAVCMPVCQHFFWLAGGWDRTWNFAHTVHVTVCDVVSHCTCPIFPGSGVMHAYKLCIVCILVCVAILFLDTSLQ